MKIFKPLYIYAISVILIFTFTTFCQIQDRLTEKIVLDFGRCGPVIFTPIIAPLTVKIEDVTYTSYNQLQSYKLQIISNRELINIKIKVNLEKWVSGLCKDKTYTVEMNGKELSCPSANEFETMEKKT